MKLIPGTNQERAGDEATEQSAKWRQPKSEMTLAATPETGVRPISDPIPMREGVDAICKTLGSREAKYLFPYLSDSTVGTFVEGLERF